jgi:hypothetical protein
MNVTQLIEVLQKVDGSLPVVSPFGEFWDLDEVSKVYLVKNAQLDWGNPTPEALALNCNVRTFGAYELIYNEEGNVD